MGTRGTTPSKPKLRWWSQKSFTWKEKGGDLDKGEEVDAFSPLHNNCMHEFKEFLKFLISLYHSYPSQ